MKKIMISFTYLKISKINLYVFQELISLIQFKINLHSFQSF